MDKDKYIQVTILGREYTLRTSDEGAYDLQKTVDFLNERIDMFSQAHPDQPEITASVITALGLAEELLQARNTITGLTLRLKVLEEPATVEEPESDVDEPRIPVRYRRKTAKKQEDTP